MYNVDDIVTLSAARGGWQGVISDILTLGTPELYQVENLNYDDRIDGGSTIVAGVDIASAHTDYPAWQIGDPVTLYEVAGEITAIDGRMITVRIEQQQNEDITFRRDHIVPRWRLLIENNT